jgi:hypothetical protein
VKVVFLTPWASLVALAVVVPLGALWLQERRAARVRRVLGLEAPGRRSHVPTAAALVVCFGLLGAAAAQPAARGTSSTTVREDAEVFVVFDTTRSMSAAAAPGTPTRFERARAFALELGAALSDVQVGVATITNRPLPHLFPTADVNAFVATVTRAIGINNPPPGPDFFRRTTSLESMEAFADENFFTPDAIQRLVILLSDGESHGFAPKTLARKLERGGVELIFVRFWSPNERIWLPGGGLDPGYRPDSYAHSYVVELASLTVAGRLFEESELGAVISAARAYLGTGREGTLTAASRAIPLGLYLVLAAGLPLAYLLGRGLGGRPAGRLAAVLHTVCSRGAWDPRGRRRPAHEDREHGRGGVDPGGHHRRAARAGPASEGGRARA